jgi:hypothetical protein
MKTLTTEEELNVKSMLEIDVEIDSIESILKLKRERQREKLDALSPDKFFAYNEQKIEQNIARLKAMKFENTFIEDDEPIDLSKLKINKL